MLYKAVIYRPEWFFHTLTPSIKANTKGANALATFCPNNHIAEKAPSIASPVF